MQCEEFEDRLNAVLDERKQPEADAELALHCETCSECRQLAAAYGQLLDGFYALVTRETSSDMAARVLAELQPHVAPRHRRAVAAAALAVAAGLLIAVIPLLRSVPEAPVTTLPRTAAHSPVQAAIPFDVKQLPIVHDLLALRDDDENPYTEIARGAGQGLARAVLFVPGIGGRKSIVGLAEAERADDPAWAVQVSEGLKPLTDSVAATFNLLLRAMPISASDS